MYFPFECRTCRKDKWTIRYDSEEKVHAIQCANCGANEVLEEIFGKRRSKKSGSRSKIKKVVKEERKAIETGSGETKERIFKTPEAITKGINQG